MLRQEPVKMPDSKRAPDYLNPDGTPVGSEQKPSVGKKPGTTGGGGDEPQSGGGKKPEEDPEGYIPPDWDGENKTEVIRVQPPWKYEDGEPKTAETDEKPPEGMELVGYRKLREIQVYCIKNNGAPFKYKIDGKELKKKVREPKNILASPVSLCCDMDEFTGYDASSGKYHFGQSLASLKWTMPSERIDIYYSKEKGYRTFPSNLVFNCTGVSRAALRCSKYSGLKKNYSYKGMNIFVSAEPGKMSVDYDLGKKHENDTAEFADAKKNRVIYRQERSSYTSSFGTEPYAYSIADLDKKQKREMSATKTVTVDTNRGFGGGGYYYACIQAGLSNYCDFNAAGILPGDSYPGNGNIKSYVYFIYENRDPDVGPQEPPEPTKQEPEEEEERP